MKALEEICSVVMLPTNDIEADICKYLPGGMLAYRSTELAYHTNQHLYICRNTEIKENDYAYFNGDIKRAVSNVVLSKDNAILKIEASTNRSLGLLDIPEWFVKKFVIMQGKIDKVRIEMEEFVFLEGVDIDDNSKINSTSIFKPRVDDNNMIVLSLVEDSWDDIFEELEKDIVSNSTLIKITKEYLKKHYSVPTKL